MDNSTSRASTSGFVYAVYGQKYINEARASALSVRKYHSEPIILITKDSIDCPPEFDGIIVDPQMRDKWGCKISMIAAPFERFICLDCDCRVLGPLHEVFDVLDAFDLAVPAALGGYHYELPNVPHAFREYSTHFIAVRRSPQIQTFFDLWRNLYDQLFTEMQGEGDQRSFRKALYDSHAVRICTLSDEWAFSAYPGGILCADVKVIHARPESRLNLLERQVNRKLGYRALLFPFPAIYSPDIMTVSDWLSPACSATVSEIRKRSRPIRGFIARWHR